MYNLGDDSELDRLSRDAANRYQTPGAPDWERMETELDKIMPVTQKRRFGGYWLLLPVLLAAGGAAYWLGSGDSNSVKENISNQTTTKPIAPAKSAADIAPAQASSKTEQESVKPAPAKSGTDIAAGSATRSYIRRTQSAPVSDNQDLAAATKTKHNTEAQKIPDAAAIKEENPGKQEAVKADKNGLIQEAPVATAAANEPAPQTNTVNTATEKTAEIKSTEQAPEPSTGKTGLIPHYAPFGKGWSVGFLLGIDKSTVKFAYSSSAGVNAGITAGYHFNQHWSLHTGAIYTFKNYKMKGEDFTPPKGSWVNYYKIENVDGSCSMWEVPLLARYSFTPHGRNSFFLSTGLSSYFMTHENYSYFFYYNNQPVTRSMDYASKDNYFLSILHLSAGYENRLTEKLSLIVEPYAKLPLAGLGLGDIQLSSFGLNFSLQLRQPAHK